MKMISYVWSEAEWDSLLCCGARLSSRNHTLPQLQQNTHTHTREKHRVTDDFLFFFLLPYSYGQNESYLCVPGERGVDYSGQELAVDGSGRDDLCRGHGGDAVQRLALGVLVLHRNRGHDKIRCIWKNYTRATGFRWCDVASLAMLILVSAQLT